MLNEDEMDFNQFNAGQKAFIDQQARIHLIRWCELQLLMASEKSEHYECCRGEGDRIYWEYAILKGWVSKASGKVTSSGYKVASAMVKKGTGVISSQIEVKHFDL